jgi:signal transduction histidine kinase
MLAVITTIVAWRLRVTHRLADQAARVAERISLARDLHDEVGARIVEMSLIGGMLDQLPPEAAKPLRQRLAELSGDIDKSLRDTLHGLDPRADTLPGFWDYLTAVLGKRLPPGVMKLQLDFPGDIPSWPLAGPLRRQLLLAVSEAVTNAVKHSGGSQIALRLRIEPAGFALEVADNGRGLPADGVPTHAGGGHGLPGLRARLAALGGEALFNNLKPPASGLVVRLVVPLKPPGGGAAAATRSSR